MKIYYLGPTKTFSEQAALSFANILPKNAHYEATPLANFELIANSIKTDSTSSLGVLPYYNFLEGLVQESLDLICEYGLHIITATRISITFSIGKREDYSESNIILSYPKALAQCSDYIKSNYPAAKIKPVSSTAEAAKIVRKTGIGFAIASKSALTENELVIISNDIGNKRYRRSNFTDFLLVSKEKIIVDSGDQIRTMIAVIPNIDRVGLLAEILAQFSFYNINIAKIHSRPAIDIGQAVNNDIEHQMFYLEVMDSEKSSNLIRCLESLQYRFKSEYIARVLGSFTDLNQF